MEEQAQKRNTDCLYFLASPLTCKKGSECDYRHSDSARLNPRDCWYWLNGNCRNPNCAFRHPPLEGINGVKADSFYTPSFSAVPTSKSNVPCYFYFNAICAKGEQCPYLHDTFPTQKASKVVPEATANCPVENKISSGDTGPEAFELPVNPPAETLMVLTKTNNHPKEVAQQAVPSCALEERSPSADSVAPECEEPADNPLPSLEFMDYNGQLSPYQSSEELVKECVEQELDERWESSPGFDVLVDDGSEHLAYEDDVDYELARNRESELLHSHVVEYEFEGSAGYDHSGYPDTGYLYDGLYEKYDHRDDIYTNGYFQQNSELQREERTIEPMYVEHHRPKKLLRRVREVHARDDVMELRKRMDARWLPLNSRKRRRSHAHGGGQERPMRHEINGSMHHRRLVSQVGRCMLTVSQGEDEYTYKDHDKQGWQGHSGTSRFTRSRLRERERRRHKNPPHISSEVQLSSALDVEESDKTIINGFTGPKTLAQIKEEKSSRVKADGKYSQGILPQFRRRLETPDFEGPKPLEELLKDKRRSERPQVSMCAKLEHVDVGCKVKMMRTSDAEINDWHHEATAGKQDRETVNGHEDDECHGNINDDDDDDDNDDDVFRRKLSHILSH